MLPRKLYQTPRTIKKIATARKETPEEKKPKKAALGESRDSEHIPFLWVCVLVQLYLSNGDQHLNSYGVGFRDEDQH